MSFAQPLFLFGALAALIPLLVHLFDRRRPRQQPFGPISFVLRSQKRTASRLKLKRLILYALRTLILLAIPVALARPQFNSSGNKATTQRTGPHATAIVLDASLSMRWGTNFEKAREEAKSALKDLSSDEPATVVLCEPGAQTPPAPAFDKARLLSLLDDAKPSFGPAELTRCFDLAARALEESPLPAKRLVVVSDFAATSLRLEASPPTITGPKGEALKPEVVLRDVSEGQDGLPNRALVELKTEAAPQAGARAWSFTFTVRNFSNLPAKDLELQLSVDGKPVAKGFVDLPANGVAQKTLTWLFQEGGTHVVDGSLVADGLKEDDVRTTVLAVPRELKALVVDGSPSPQRLRDEAFFVDAALSAAGSPVRPVVRDSESAWREDLKAFDVVMLLNVEAPAPEVAAKLKAFVENGGGLFVSVGDRVEPEAFNASLGALLPRPLRVVKTAVEPNAPDAAARAAKLSQFAGAHPVLSPFTGRAREGLISARFFRSMLLEARGAGGVDDAEVLATLDDGTPALVTAKRGKGRVLLFTSTVDRDWADFAIRTSFLPLVQRLAAWLSGALDERAELKAFVGDVVLVPKEQLGGARDVSAPSGAKVAVLVGADGSARVGPVKEPGAHLGRDAEGAVVPTASFAVTVDPLESDLTHVDGAALEGWFGEETVRAGPASAQHRDVPVWTWLIVAAVVAFVGEGVLLRK